MSKVFFAAVSMLCLLSACLPEPCPNLPAVSVFDQERRLPFQNWQQVSYFNSTAPNDTLNFIIERDTYFTKHLVDSCDGFSENLQLTLSNERKGIEIDARVYTLYRNDLFHVEKLQEYHLREATDSLVYFDESHFVSWTGNRLFSGSVIVQQDSGLVQFSTPNGTYKQLR